MIQIELYGKPTPWAASRTNGKHHYNPKNKEKEHARWQIKAQYRDTPLTGAISLDFTFFMPIPKSTSLVKRKQMLSHLILPTVKVDATNLQKFYEDCLKGIVIEDDQFVTDVASRKRYSEKPGVLIRIISLITHMPNFRQEGKDAIN